MLPACYVHGTSSRQLPAHCHRPRSGGPRQGAAAGLEPAGWLCWGGRARRPLCSGSLRASACGGPWLTCWCSTFSPLEPSPLTCWCSTFPPLEPSPLTSWCSTFPPLGPSPLQSTTSCSWGNQSAAQALMALDADSPKHVAHISLVLAVCSE